MAAEKDLKALLANMEPLLSEEEYVFCSLEEEELARLGSRPIATFREEEAVSVIILRTIAEQEGLDAKFTARMIKLGVQSSLDAVGFLAAITAKLADAGISVNPVAAFYHDYIFVPAERAEDAIAVLQRLMAEST